jgi:hypothetical protein
MILKPQKGDAFMKIIWIFWLLLTLSGSVFAQSQLEFLDCSSSLTRERKSSGYGHTEMVLGVFIKKIKDGKYAVFMSGKQEISSPAVHKVRSIAFAVPRRFSSQEEALSFIKNEKKPIDFYYLDADMNVSSAYKLKYNPIEHSLVGWSCRQKQR